MNSFLAKSIGVSLFLIAVAAFYYLVIYIPERNDIYSNQQQRLQSENEINNKKKCLSEGEKLYKEDNASAYGSLSDPKYYYNSKLNTCIYSVQTTYPWSTEDREEFPTGCVPYEIKVVDTFTRERILFIGQNGPTCETYPISRKEFDEKYQDLFSE